MKILIVKYLPSHPNSNTALLLQHFEKQVPGSVDIEFLDLLEKDPPFFKKDSLSAYVKRNIFGQELNDQEKNVLKPFDELVSQVKKADGIVMAFPMHNFSMPGIIKTYIDAIMFDRETWYHGDVPSQYVPLMKGRKAVTLSASGGMYISPPNPWDHLTSLIRVDLEFMGFETNTVLAEGMVRPDDIKAQSFSRCYKEIESVARNWFSGVVIE